jgi:hypothetical protein
MMKKMIKFFIYTFFLSSVNTFAQIGINTLTPQATLDIVEPNPTNPSNTSGVIVPRVTTLNTTNAKEVGLLVFFNSPDVAQRGFYWWNGTAWRPFISINKVRDNKTITFASTESNFKEGEMTKLPETDIRTLKFATFNSNVPANFQIDASGNFVVKKTGYYHIQAASFMKKSFTANSNRRDQLDMKIYVNGKDASLDKADNYNLEGTKGFPAGIVTISINAAGVMKLNANDYLTMKIVRSYRDITPDTDITIIPEPNTLSNITLRYLGDF